MNASSQVAALVELHVGKHLDAGDDVGKHVDRQHDAGAHVRHAGQAEQHLVQEAFVMLHVRHGHVESARDD